MHDAMVLMSVLFVLILAVGLWGIRQSRKLEKQEKERSAL